MKYFWTACLSIVLSVAAQFALKAGMNSAAVKNATASEWKLQTLQVALAQPGVILGFVLYGLGALVWLVVLSKWDVSKAYPMVGLGFALSLAIGAMSGNRSAPAECWESRSSAWV